MAKFSAGQKVVFQFGGGEPTIYPKFLEWVKGLTALGHEVVITSNGSRHSSFWEEMIRYANVNISVHFESADLDRLYENFETMIKVRMSERTAGGLEIKLMCPPGVVEKGQAFRDRILGIPKFESYAAWSLVPIRYPIINRKLAAMMMDYNQRELEILQQQV